MSVCSWSAVCKLLIQRFCIHRQVFVWGILRQTYVELCLQDLEAEQVVHFDLKCDNILLEPHETPRDPAALPFRVVLSDFGESRIYSSASSALTVR